MNAFIKLLMVAMGIHSGIIFAQSTATVGGTILDKSGLPIADLTISLDPGEYTTTTNTDGYFQFYKLPEGRYTASITGVGYKSLQHKFSVVDGKPIALNLRMEAFANNMSEVIVTGRSAVKEVNRQAFTVTAIDAKHLYTLLCVRLH